MWGVGLLVLIIALLVPPAWGQSLQEAERLLAEVKRLQEAIGSLDRTMAITEETARLHAKVKILSETGKYQEAIPLAKRALAIAEKALPKDDPAGAISLHDWAMLYMMATLLDDLAGLYNALGAYSQAEPLYQRALAIVEKALPPGHPHIAMSLLRLAELYQILGAYSQAEDFLKKVLAIVNGHRKVYQSMAFLRVDAVKVVLL